MDLRIRREGQQTVPPRLGSGLGTRVDGAMMGTSGFRGRWRLVMEVMEEGDRRWRRETGDGGGTGDVCGLADSWGGMGWILMVDRAVEDLGRNGKLESGSESLGQL